MENFIPDIKNIKTNYSNRRTQIYSFTVLTYCMYSLRLVTMILLKGKTLKKAKLPFKQIT